MVIIYQLSTKCGYVSQARMLGLHGEEGQTTVRCAASASRRDRRRLPAQSSLEPRTPGVHLQPPPRVTATLNPQKGASSSPVENEMTNQTKSTDIGTQRGTLATSHCGTAPFSKRI